MTETQSYEERLHAARAEFFEAAVAYEDAAYAWYASDPAIFEGLCETVVKGLTAQKFPDECDRVRAANNELNSLTSELDAVAERAHRANYAAAKTAQEAQAAGQPHMRILWEYDRPSE